MPASKNLNTFGDIRLQLDEIRALGGARLSFAHKAEATKWIARAYSYRRLLQQQSQAIAGDVPGFVASTPYDDLIIRRQLGSTEVIVEFGVKLTKMTVTPLEKLERTVAPTQTVPMELLPVTEEDELMKAVTAAIQKEGDI